MEYFLKNQNTALDRNTILNHIWGDGYYGDDKIVDVNIRRIRMKIEDEPSNPKYLLTIWGFDISGLQDRKTDRINNCKGGFPVSKYNKFGKHSITKHWLWSSLSVISVVLVIIEILLIAVIRNYYYSSAKQYVTSKMNVITSSVMRTSDDGEANHNTEIHALVEGLCRKG